MCFQIINLPLRVYCQPPSSLGLWALLVRQLINTGMWQSSSPNSKTSTGEMKRQDLHLMIIDHLSKREECNSCAAAHFTSWFSWVFICIAAKILPSHKCRCFHAFRPDKGLDVQMSMLCGHVDIAHLVSQNLIKTCNKKAQSLLQDL